MLEVKGIVEEQLYKKNENKIIAETEIDCFIGESPFNYY
jgi:hypothetical protein